MRKILLFDGNSIINRAFYATPALTNKNGIYTNAVYGFINMFYKFIDEEKPDCVGVCFDLPRPTFRHLKFEGYKAGRRKAPEELRSQIPLLKELLIALAVPVYELEGSEADDLLGTLAKKAEAGGDTAVIVSGDRDLLQIASDKIKIRIPKTKGGKTEVADYDADGVFDEYGVTPAQFIDVKALMGDASDNIPGVSGIGEKTALKIITEYKTLDNAIENAASIKPKKAGETLLLERDTALLSRELATIITDVPVELQKSAYTGEITEDGLAFFERLEFKSLISRLGLKKTEAVQKSDVVFSIVTDLNAFASQLTAQTLASYCVFEQDGDICGISFCFDEKNAYFVEIETPLHESMILSALMPFFESSCEKLTIDAKPGIKSLATKGIHVKNVVLDAAVAGYVLNPLKQAYGYDYLASEYLSENHASEEDVFGKGKGKTGIANSLSLEKKKTADYCANVANVVFRLSGALNKRLEETAQLSLYREIEHPLINVLADMEMRGIKVDKAILGEFGEMLSDKIDSLTQSIYAHAKHEFNINSPKQLGEILFEELGLKSLKKTKTGYSTNIEELERLKHEHPIIEEIIEYRSYTKLKSTYVDGLLAAVDTKTDKLHTTFNQTVTATGRLSSVEPNLQNIPVRLSLGRELRKAFVPDGDEYVFLDGDYSQIELRILAHISEDETLINAFKDGLDIHRMTAAQVNDMPYELITPGLRSAAKAVNFGIIYGIGAYSLSIDLGISKFEADKYIKAYFAAYPKIKGYLDNSVSLAKETGFAETMFGRKRPVQELLSANHNIRSFGERVAMNMPIQGAAADIIKIAMIKVFNALNERNMKTKMLLQVHDELLLMAHRDEADEAASLLKSCMQDAATLLVPLEVDVHQGGSWFEAK